jgi:hypothetical protein
MEGFFIVVVSEDWLIPLQAISQVMNHHLQGVLFYRVVLEFSV